MGVCDTQELDRLSGVRIIDISDIENKRLNARCLDCGRVTHEDDICATDDGEDCCDCGSTRLDWFEE